MDYKGVKGMDVGLTDKVVMVAAGTKGLGFGIAGEAAKEGAKVAIGSRSAEHVEEAVSALVSETDAAVYGATVDVRDRTSIDTWCDAVLDRWGTIDCLVTNAGGPPPGRFDEFEDSQWSEAFELTLMSVVRLIRKVLPVMKEKGSGSIVTVTSTSIKEPIESLLLSGVMRSGVASLAKSLALELASYGIRVNNLVPGGYFTDRMKAILEKQSSDTGIDFETIKHEMTQDVALGRFGIPQEFGKAAVFLLSDAASYVTGETFIVDGGRVRTTW
jgi:3-oxoacyl-[acyl-carrier protein] reductase